MTEKSLVAILIPTGNLKECERRGSYALKKYFKNKSPYILISGQIDWENNEIRKDCAQYQIYSQLRKEGVLPKDMIIEGKSKNSLENFLYSIKKLNDRGIKKCYITTNFTHYERFRLFYEYAKKEKLIPEDFEIKSVHVKETFYEYLYGFLAYVNDYFKIKSSPSLEQARIKKEK